MKQHVPFYYGYIVIGPSGSGKTTFSKGLSQIFSQINRKFTLINLDPAAMTEKDLFQIDVRDLIAVEEVMEELQLGPNAALLYCFNFLVQNINWLEDQLLQYQNTFLIFDMPGILVEIQNLQGQIELYLQNDSIEKLIQVLIQEGLKLCISLTAIQMFDCVNCYEDNHYISQCLMNLISQINLQLPYIAVISNYFYISKLLSKIDLIKQMGKTPMNLEYYLEASELSYIFDKGLKKEKSKFEQKYSGLSLELSQFIDQWGRVSFIPLSVENKMMMIKVIIEADRANGFYFEQQQEGFYKQILKELDFDNEEEFYREILMQLENLLDEDDL